MKPLILAGILAVTPMMAFAEEEATAEQIAKIEAKLATMQCQMDPDDIEVEDDGGFDLDDVACFDGQYDIKLDANFEETGRRKE